MLLAPFFLIGLLAIGLPLWLHRFARRTEIQRKFASLMLLETSEVNRSRRHTLMYLLLLALRIALLAALVFAFAEPVLRSRSPLLSGHASTLHIVVLDTSLSMQQGDRWQRAVEKAGALLDAVDARDRVMLVAADHRVRVLQEPVFAGSVAPLRAAMATLKPELTRLDYGMLMTTADSWIAARERPAVLHLITDLQESALPLRFADLSPPAGVQLQLEDVGNDKAGNLAITSAALAEQDSDALDVHLAGELPKANATNTSTARQATGRTANERTLILEVDGQERARHVLSVNDLGPAGYRFAGLKLGLGQHRVVVRIEPQDGLPQDDQFFAAIRRDDPRVLILAQNTAADDATYLAAAVTSITRPKLQVDRLTPAQLKPSALADYAAVIVSDAGILSNDTAAAIQRYAQNGGSVMMTLGERAAAMRTVPVSGHTFQRAPLAGNKEPDRVATVEQSHPVLRNAQGWRSVRFFRSVSLEARDNDRVLLRSERGVPLLLEQQMGKGHLLLFASSLARDWNDLAIDPLFVRFVGESARYLTGLDATASSATVGSIVTAGLTGVPGAQVFDPKGQRALALGESGASTRLVPDQVGFYEMRGGGRVEWLAVNVDGRESQMARLPEDSIRRWQALQPENAPAADAAAPVNPDAAQPAQPEAPLIPLWFWILLLATVLAFVEPLVANYHLHVRREGSV